MLRRKTNSEKRSLDREKERERDSERAETNIGILCLHVHICS